MPPLLRRLSSDEYAPIPPSAEDERESTARVNDIIDAAAGSLGLSTSRVTRSIGAGTAATLQAINDAHGGGFFVVPDRALHEVEAADAAFGGDAPVIDVQTHLVDPSRWVGAGAGRARGLPADGRSRSLAGAVDPRLIDGAAWAAHVFGASGDRDRTAHVDARAADATC